MHTLVPGDRLVIGGGMFRRVIAVSLNMNRSDVTLRDDATKRVERVLLDTVYAHMETGWVRLAPTQES